MLSFLNLTLSAFNFRFQRQTLCGKVLADGPQLDQCVLALLIPFVGLSLGAFVRFLFGTESRLGIRDSLFVFLSARLQSFNLGRDSLLLLGKLLDSGSGRLARLVVRAQPRFGFLDPSQLFVLRLTE